MSFDVAGLLRARHGENFALHDKYLNHQLTRALKTIGFDRFYVRGEGCYLFDAEGDRYLDLLSGFGVYALGRSHPAIKAALHQAIDLDLPNMVQMDCSLLPGLLAEQLVRRCRDNIDRVFFCNSGAEAVESAIKFSRHATHRPRILFAEHAFHGLSTGALALNGGTEFREGFGQLLPGCSSVPFGDAAALRRELQKGDVAAFIVEPIQGKGVYMAPLQYWKEAQELCRRHGSLLVLDEVQTGLGRTGKFFCFEHWDLEPDIITTSKALSGGYIPVGAMLTSDRVFCSVFSSVDKALKHSTTFGRNQLAMVAGLATLAVFDDENIIERARLTGEAFRSALAPLVQEYEMFHEVRGKGLMIGLQFGSPSRRRSVDVSTASSTSGTRSSPRCWWCLSSIVIGSLPRSLPTTSTSSSCSRPSSAGRRRSTTSSPLWTMCSRTRTAARDSCSSSAAPWPWVLCGGPGSCAQMPPMSGPPRPGMMPMGRQMGRSSSPTRSSQRLP